MQLSLALTARCNARCTHCTTNSGPEQTRALSPAKTRNLMDEAAAMAAPGEELVFGLTGGEAFLDLPGLLEIVEHGARLGARVTCVSNAYWASSDEKARVTLAALKQAGLHALGLSTSRFHQHYVKIERVRRAVAIAREFSIVTVLKCAVTAQDRREGLDRSWPEFVGADRVQVFPVVPYLRQGATLPEGDYIRTPGLPEGRCPAAILTVLEDGAAYTCCNPGGFAPLLSLGNVHEAPLHELHELYHVQGKQQILRELGPIHFAHHAQARGQGHRLRSAYADVCDLCGHLASDPVLSALAEDAGESFEKAQLERMLAGMMEDA